MKQKNCSRLVSKILFATIFISLIFLKTSLAQDTSYRYYPELTRYALISDPDSLIAIDTMIGNFHRFNPAEHDFGLLHNGFLGAPATFKFYNPSLSPDIDIGFHAYDFYWRRMEDVKFYNTIEPYTAFHYQQGSKSELLVNIDHAQNINRNLSVGINFNRFRTNGWYQRQESRISNMDGFLHFKTNSNKYQCVAAYVLNSLKTDENGGVKNENLFGDTVLFDKTLADINLDSAKATWKNNEIMMLNVIHFGKWIEANKKDSTSKRKVIPKVRLQERFEWERRNYLFYDYANDGPYYVADTLEWKNVRDTFRFDRIMNEVRLTKLNRYSLKHNLMWDGNVFFRHQIYFTHNKGTDQNLQAAIPGGELNLYFKSNIHLSSLFEYNILGRNAGDYHFNASLTYSINNTIDFNVDASVSTNHPSLIESEYHSAYYNWVNDFSSEKKSEAKFSFIEKRWNIVLSAKVFTANNFIYWNQSRTPQQLAEQFSGYQFFLQKDFTFKTVHLDNELMYQSYNIDSVVSFPPFVIRSSLYYQNKIFKKAMLGKVGADINYTSLYYNPAYIGATGQYLVQSTAQDSYLPTIDAFVSVRVRGVRAYILFQNIFSSGSFSAFPYPMPDRAFKFGFEWKFWD